MLDASVLAHISSELRTCDEREATIKGLLEMIEPGDKETLAYLHHRHALWEQYRAALLFVRDQRPDIAPESADAHDGRAARDA
jgi:hypothetical protein